MKLNWVKHLRLAPCLDLSLSDVPELQNRWFEESF